MEAGLEDITAPAPDSNDFSIASAKLLSSCIHELNFINLI